MKRTTHTLTLLVILCLCTPITRAQLPTIQWTKTVGGSGTEVPFTIKFAHDGGTISAGYTDSRDGLGHGAERDYWDLYITKLSRCGDLEWQHSYGGTGYETARDLLATPDGGYLVLGETNSTDGDVIAGYGGTKDIWLLKLDGQGTLQWQKRLGGSGLDIGNSIVSTPDGNYMIAASTSSNDGDMAGNHGSAGYTDGALIKINPVGNVLWSRCYGGSKNDELLDIEIIDNKIYVAGYANSIDGDIPATQKNYDVWLLCTDLNGGISFSKIYGGSQNDVAYSMCVGKDRSLTLAGYTTSSDGQVTGSKGSQDFWVINISTTGVLKWQQTAGGTEAEFANAIIADGDGGYIAGGISYSENGDVTSPQGEGDYWIVKLNSLGHIVWKQSFGGKKTDHLHSILFNASLNEYYLAGDAASRTPGVDFEIIKLKLPAYDTVVCTEQKTADTVQDICGYDSVIVICRPATIEESYAFTQIQMPNAFTPNGDGRNDEFGAAGRYVTDFFMQIFNRYGELVFQSNAVNQKWNGNYKGRPQPAGSFVYNVRYIDNENRQQVARGVFTLIR